jgi:hypothetical protein
MNRPGGDSRPAVPGELPAHLEQREHHAQAEADRLRAAIAELSDQLDQVQQLVERLRLTRQTLLEVAEPEPVDDRLRPIDTLPSAYQEIVAVFARTDGGLRAKDLCRALGIGDQPRHTEAIRAKLKRLVGRDILSEPEPGLFTMNRAER